MKLDQLMTLTSENERFWREVYVAAVRSTAATTSMASSSVARRAAEIADGAVAARDKRIEPLSNYAVEAPDEKLMAMATRWRQYATTLGGASGGSYENCAQELIRLLVERGSLV